MILKLEHQHRLHRWRAGGFQNVALAAAPLTFVLKHVPRGSRIEGGRFSKCSSRWSAAQFRPNKLQSVAD
eukprot:7867036-Pyramimonas_sp.AAC.1